MKRFVLLLLSALLLSWTPLRPGMGGLSNDTFSKGEFLKYRIHYGWINAGYCTLTVDPQTQMIKDWPCHHIVLEGYTNKTFDAFYKVRDKYESYFDEEEMVSRRFCRSIREGKFRSYTETQFDQTGLKAIYFNDRKEKTVYDISENMQDVISAYYFARVRYKADELEIGDLISLRNFIDRKTVGLQARMLAREVIKLDGQKYRSLKMELLIEEAGLITDGSKILLWVSDDENKIPLRVESKLAIGSVKIDLMEYRNLRHPLSCRVTDLE